MRMCASKILRRTVHGFIGWGFLAWVFSELGLAAQPVVGWSTNGPAVFALLPTGTEVVPGPPVSFLLPPTNLPPEVRRAMVVFRPALNVVVVTNSVPRFDHYVPESLHNAVWTNFLANTNGRSTLIWSPRDLSFNWPGNIPVVRWNSNSLVWGMKGLTAMCPCWEAPPGFIPMTAFTRRHGYARGHSMGPDGFGSNFVGLKAWFLTAKNEVVQRKIVRQVVRTREVSNRDYTILLFDSDLPESIEPMRVVRESDVFGAPPCPYPYVPDSPNLLFKTEQNGNVSAGVPGFTLETMKMGDSGSPNMLPLPGELAFWNGRTTSGVSPEMQADMDKLCRLEELNPAKYQLQYVDFTRYPRY